MRWAQKNKYLGHLREDEAAVAARVQLPEQLGEHLQLAAVPLDEPLVGEGERLADEHRLLQPQRRVGDRAKGALKGEMWGRVGCDMWEKWVRWAKHKKRD